MLRRIYFSVGKGLKENPIFCKILSMILKKTPDIEEENMSFPEFHKDAAKLFNEDINIVSRFPDGPQGITIHYTADRDVKRSIDSLVSQKLAYHFIIGRDGKMFQMAPLTHSVWHAGNAKWLGKSPNREHISVALTSWGYLDYDSRTGDRKSWSGTVVAPNEVGFRPSNVDSKGRWWDIATSDQKSALNKLMLWFVDRGINIEDICGHDEAAIPSGRKMDPGGVLPLRMYEYREFLNREHAKKINLT